MQAEEDGAEQDQEENLDDDQIDGDRADIDEESTSHGAHSDNEDGQHRRERMQPGAEDQQHRDTQPGNTTNSNSRDLDYKQTAHQQQSGSSQATQIVEEKKQDKSEHKPDVYMRTDTEVNAMQSNSFVVPKGRGSLDKKDKTDKDSMDTSHDEAKVPNGGFFPNANVINNNGPTFHHDSSHEDRPSSLRINPSLFGSPSPLHSPHSRSNSQSNSQPASPGRSDTTASAVPSWISSPCSATSSGKSSRKSSTTSIVSSPSTSVEQSPRETSDTRERRFALDHHRANSPNRPGDTADLQITLKQQHTQPKVMDASDFVARHTRNQTKRNAEKS
jgi:hypothetical protein